MCKVSLHLVHCIRNTSELTNRPTNIEWTDISKPIFPSHRPFGSRLQGANWRFIHIESIYRPKINNGTFLPLNISSFYYYFGKGSSKVSLYKNFTWCMRLTDYNGLMPFFNIISVMAQRSCFPGVLFTSTLQNILSKSLATFPHNHRRNNGQWQERNEFCRNHYNQSLERIFSKLGFEPATSS